MMWARPQKKRRSVNDNASADIEATSGAMYAIVPMRLVLGIEETFVSFAMPKKPISAAGPVISPLPQPSRHSHAGGSMKKTPRRRARRVVMSTSFPRRASGFDVAVEAGSVTTCLDNHSILTAGRSITARVEAWVSLQSRI